MTMEVEWQYRSHICTYAYNLSWRYWTIIKHCLLSKSNTNLTQFHIKWIVSLETDARIGYIGRYWQPQITIVKINCANLMVNRRANLSKFSFVCLDLLRADINSSRDLLCRKVYFAGIDFYSSPSSHPRNFSLAHY